MIVGYDLKSRSKTKRSCCRCYLEKEREPSIDLSKIAAGIGSERKLREVCGLERGGLSEANAEGVEDHFWPLDSNTFWPVHWAHCSLRYGSSDRRFSGLDM